MASGIIVPTVGDKKKRFLVRFENGASVAVESTSIGAAPGDAFTAVVGAIPANTDISKIVQPVLVQLMENVCACCGKRFGQKEFMEFQPRSGNPSVMCLWCVEAVCTAAAKLGGDDGTTS